RLTLDKPPQHESSDLRVAGQPTARPTRQTTKLSPPNRGIRSFGRRMQRRTRQSTKDAPPKRCLARPTRSRWVSAAGPPPGLRRRRVSWAPDQRPEDTTSP